MTRSSALSALALPAAGGWDFGDYLYAVEPLTLPHPHEPASAPGPLAAAEVEDGCLAFLAQVRAGVPATDPVDQGGLERLFWFRWMVGHHVSFVIWRLIAGALARIAAGDSDREALSEAVAHYVQGYCGMLLYTGSSDRRIYNDVIRPSMYRQHSTFSGTWAPDYPPVRSLFRGRRRPPVADPYVEAVAREVHLASELHFGVAAKLVVGGRSLLQTSIAERDAAQPRMWGAIFDCYFVTLRVPVSTPQLVAQLLRRQKAIAIDLATNGLYPAGAVEDLPSELRQPAARACAEDLTNSLCRVAGLAAGLTLDRVNKELGCT